jgi:hypothetical protein
MLLTLTADRWCALLGFLPSCHGHTRFHTHDQPSAFDLSVGGSSSPIYFAANKELNEFARFSAAKPQSRRTLHTLLQQQFQEASTYSCSFCQTACTPIRVTLHSLHVAWNQRCW